MTQLSPESQITRCLEDGETLYWAGKPDTKAFLKGLFKTSFGANNIILGNPLPPQYCCLLRIRISHSDPDRVAG